MRVRSSQTLTLDRQMTSTLVGLTFSPLKTTFRSSSTGYQGSSAFGFWDVWPWGYFFLALLIMVFVKTAAVRRDANEILWSNSPTYSCCDNYRDDQLEAHGYQQDVSCSGALLTYS